MSVDAAYRARQNDSDAIAALRDHVVNMGHVDKMERLLDLETAHERTHRKLAPNGWRAPLSARTAAKLILLTNARKGVDLAEMPSATGFLIWRDSAVYAELIGFIVRDYLDAAWRESVALLDYSEIMA